MSVQYRLSRGVDLIDQSRPDLTHTDTDEVNSPDITLKEGGVESSERFGDIRTGDDDADVALCRALSDRVDVDSILSERREGPSTDPDSLMHRVTHERQNTQTSSRSERFNPT